MSPILNAETTKPTASDRQQTVTEDFLSLIGKPNTQVAKTALDNIQEQWHAGMTSMALEALYFTQSSTVRRRLTNMLIKETRLRNRSDLDPWYQWLWNRDVASVEGYDNFKADLYRQIDPRFEKYFRDRQDTAQIRLDEIRWGGVRQDGIPPLRTPEMIAASDATYLKDHHTVFGIEINGDARAYPKRILAWHEMFTDTIGGVDIAGVYCTLCGTVIPYVTSVDGVDYQLGTSGFLYRSNKLMYDKATQSLWSTERGEPVLGPLVGKALFYLTKAL